MARKNNDTITDRLDEIRSKLRVDMIQARLDVTTFDYAIDITAETLLERERIFSLYMEHEKTRTDLTTVNPFSSRLASWNSQARACLNMLKLTPTRYRPPEDPDEDILTL